MARLKNNGIPGLRHHKATGKAIVELSGQTWYCGTFGTKTAKAAYDRHVAEWLARGRRPLIEQQDAEVDLTVAQLLGAYEAHAETYYRKNGKQTKELSAILSVARLLREMYGETSIDDFGPLKLRALREAMIRRGWARQSINRQIFRVRRIIRWAVSRELVLSELLTALESVESLAQGRTEAREAPPVMPVADAMVEATLPHLPPIVADMVRLQRLTGARPGEICAIRPGDIDRTGEVWRYKPASHKMQHKGRERVICIGPRAQKLLLPYLLRAADAHCFSPAESEANRRETAHARRATPIGQGNRPGTNRPGRKYPIKTYYTREAYTRAVRRGCELAFKIPAELAKGPYDETIEAKAARRAAARAWRKANAWHPNQLRHTAATEIRRRFGPEASQTVLGHAHLNTTEIYAERDFQKAATVMLEVG